MEKLAHGKSQLLMDGGHVAKKRRWGAREITALRGPSVWVGIYCRMGQNVGGKECKKGS